jgi:hypothetical protein
MPWEIEDADGVARQRLGGYADVTRGGGLKYDQVTFLGPGGTSPIPSFSLVGIGAESAGFVEGLAQSGLEHRGGQGG